MSFRDPVRIHKEPLMILSRILFAAALLTCTIFGGSFAAPRPPLSKKNAAEDIRVGDLKRLQGRWTIVHEVYVGTRQEGDRGSWEFGENTTKDRNGTDGQFTIDTTKRPKQLIRKFIDKEGRKRTLAYIYSFDDDDLLISGRAEFFDEDKPPADFGSSVHFMRMRRE